MYQHFNTRARLIRRIVAYFFMVLAILIGVVGTTAWVLGYRLDFGEQEVKQINLLQLGTFPSGARIAIDDQELNWTTPGRYDQLDAGWHKVKFWLDGYRDWNKTLNLRAAEVRWLDYVRFVPNEITTKNVASVVGFHQALTSPNGSYILLAETPAATNFKLVDISDANSPKITNLVLPVGLAAGEVNIIEWDSSSNFILANVGGEIVRIDRRTPDQSQNLTKLFNIRMSSAHFLGGNNNTVFALTGTDLRQFDVSAKTTSAPILSDVISYELYGDGKIAYVSQNEKGQDVGVWYRDKIYLYQHYDTIARTLVNFTHHWRDDYLLVAREGKLEIVNQPLNGDVKVTTIEIGEVDFLVNNGGGRMVLVGAGGKLTCYDLQVEESYTFNTEDFTGKPFWLDDFHLGYISGGTLKMMEFDGGNLETLVPATLFGAFSGNNERLFTFKTTPEGTVLQDNRMIAQ